MEKDVQIGNNLSGKSVFVPRVDETPVPCPDGYTCTNCVYCSDDVDLSYFGIDVKSNITSFLNAIVCRMREQDREIEYLKQQIKILKNDGNKW